MSHKPLSLTTCLRCRGRPYAVGLWRLPRGLDLLHLWARGLQCRPPVADGPHRPLHGEAVGCVSGQLVLRFALLRVFGNYSDPLS